MHLVKYDSVTSPIESRLINLYFTSRMSQPTMGVCVAGVCALRGSTSSVAKIARYTICYYAMTTVTAVIMGIVLVNIIQPGRGEVLGKEGSSDCGVQLTEVEFQADYLISK